MFHLKRQNIPAVTGAFRHYFAQYSLVSFYKTYLDPRWPGSSSATVRCLCLNQVGQRKTNGCYVEWSQRNKRRDGVWFRQREDDSKEVRKTKMKNDVFENCMVWTYVKYVNRSIPIKSNSKEITIKMNTITILLNLKNVTSYCVIKK